MDEYVYVKILEKALFNLRCDLELLKETNLKEWSEACQKDLQELVDNAHKLQHSLQN